MPVEVIDLLSSSSPPPPRVPAAQLRQVKNTSREGKIGASTAVTGAKSRWEKARHAEVRSRERLNSKESSAKEGWIELDDETEPALPTVPAARTFDTYNKSAYNSKDKSSPLKLPETGYGGLRLTSVAASSRKAQDEFLFLSDDFDSSINLDKDYSLPVDLQLPPAKRRRVTPEPETLPKPPALREGGFRRTASDVTTGLTYSTSRAGPPKANGLKRSATMVIDDDPITFTSSPDFVQLAKERREKRRLEAEREKDLSDVEETSRGAVGKLTQVDILDDDSDSDLPDIDVMATQARFGKMPSLSRQNSQKALAAYNAHKSASKKTASKDADKPPDKPKRIVKTAEEKLAEKEAEAERKRLIREGKARDKQTAADFAKVNMLRIDKKVSTPEMIVAFPMDLDEKLRKQAEGFLGKIEVESEEWDNGRSVKNVLRWKRKVEAKYNEKEGHWEPVPKRIEEEKHVLCYMPAVEFVGLATGDEGQDLDAHVLKMKSGFGGCKIIYLIEGLNAWMRKNRNVRNRQFTDAMRRQMGEEEVGAAGAQRARRKKVVEYVDEDMIEDALLRLQVIHGALIHHTGATVETAEWIMVFTQHISTIPYRHQRMTLDTAFCMETGQIKTGENVADTYVRMLQEIHRITAPIAYGIAEEYPSVMALVGVLRREGKDVLTHVRKSANKDGALTDRELGKSVSKRVWGIFMGTDEGSTDV